MFQAPYFLFPVAILQDSELDAASSLACPAAGHGRCFTWEQRGIMDAGRQPGGSHEFCGSSVAQSYFSPRRITLRSASCPAIEGGNNVSHPFSSAGGLGAATWAAARPYREPRRWPVRVQPFPLRLSRGFSSGEPTGELHVTEMPGRRSCREGLLARR